MDIDRSLETRVIHPSILYFGTPVVLITTRNPDGSTNITPMSSAWALADRVVIGLAGSGQGLVNLRREHECVLNLAGEDLHEAVECIAPTTGCEHVPVWKQASGYRHEADKFALAAFTRGRRAAHRRMPAATGSALQLAIERPLAAWRDFAGGYVVAELEVVRVHAHPEVTIAETHHVDPRRYYPLFYVFRHYAGRGAIRGCTLKAEV